MIISDMVRIIKKPDSFEHDFLLADSSEFTVESSDLAEHNYFFKITTDNNPQNINAVIEALLQHGLGVEKSTESNQGDGNVILGLIVTPVKEDRLKEIILEMEKLSYVQAIDYLQIY